MATLKLNKKPAAAKKTPAGTATGEKRSPLRGKGVSRPRQTLEQAQTERAERQAAFEQRRAAEDRAPRDPRDPRDARGPRDARDNRDPRAARDARGPRNDRDDRDRRDGRDDRGPRPPARSSAYPRGDAPRGDAPRDQRQGGFRRDEGPTGDLARGPRGERPQRSDRPQRDESRERQEWQDRPQQRMDEPRRDQRRNTGPRPGQPYGDRPMPPRPQPPSRARRDHDDDDDDYRDPSLEGERLSKRMGELGVASRREADEWIAAGWVRVDGKMAVLGQRVGPDVKIEIDPAARTEQAKQVTILLHKPIGYVSGQAEDGYEPASVLVKSGNHWKEDASGIKFHIGHARGLAPAGRLDIDSTGLLVLTQDGRVAKALIGEDSKVEKEYLVRVEYQGATADVGPPMQRFPAQDLALLNHGLSLDDVQLKPAKVSWINDDQLRFVLREGRKRQIRRMCELVGLKVVGLKRVRIGRVNLGHLPAGQWRYLAPWERFD